VLRHFTSGYFLIATPLPKLKMLNYFSTFA
jgi:hypothetical protein